MYTRSHSLSMCCCCGVNPAANILMIEIPLLHREFCSVEWFLFTCTQVLWMSNSKRTAETWILRAHGNVISSGVLSWGKAADSICSGSNGVTALMKRFWCLRLLVCKPALWMINSKELKLLVYALLTSFQHLCSKATFISLLGEFPSSRNGGRFASNGS